MNLNNNEQETSEVQFEEYALRLNASDFASRSKAKAKPQRRDSASSSTKTVPIEERAWTKLIHFLRYGSLPREDDGEIEFWRIKNNFQNHFHNNDTEIPEDQLKEYALKMDAKDFACRSKAKAKPQRREPAGSSPRTNSY